MLFLDGLVEFLFLLLLGHLVPFLEATRATETHGLAVERSGQLGLRVDLRAHDGTAGIDGSLGRIGLFLEGAKRAGGTGGLAGGCGSMSLLSVGRQVEMGLAVLFVEELQGYVDLPDGLFGVGVIGCLLGQEESVAQLFEVL